MLGDFWDNSDESYTGEDGDSIFSLQYYRDKANEFQAVLSAVDTAANSAYQVMVLDVNPQLTADMSAALAEYDARRWELSTAVEAINAAGGVLNAMDIRFPQLSMQSQLGIGPLIIPVGALAAVAAATAAAATLIVWGRAWIGGVNERQKQALLLDAIQDPEKRAELAAEVARSDAAASAASSASWSTDLVKLAQWAAIGVLGFLAINSM